MSIISLDFDSLVKEGNGVVRDVTLQEGKGSMKIVDFPDGGSMSMRSFSSADLPTLQITSPTGQILKLRYDVLPTAGTAP